MKVWKGTDGMTAPEERECKQYGYPNRDSKGECMYNNTYFLTEAEAWESIRASVEAGVKLAGENVKSAQSRLRDAEQRAAAAAVEYLEAMDGYHGFRREQERRPA